MASTAPQVLTVADGDVAHGVLSALAAERISGVTEETPTTGDMWRGVIAEPFARDAYAEHVGLPVDEVALIVRDLGNGVRIGYSPDGLVGEDGLVEIKAPRAKGHVETIIRERSPPDTWRSCRPACSCPDASGSTTCPSRAACTWGQAGRDRPPVAGHDPRRARLAEAGITDRIEHYRAATSGLPLTEPLPTYDDITI